MGHPKTTKRKPETGGTADLMDIPRLTDALVQLNDSLDPLLRFSQRPKRLRIDGEINEAEKGDKIELQATSPKNTRRPSINLLQPQSIEDRDTTRTEPSMGLGFSAALTPGAPLQIRPLVTDKIMTSL